MSKFFVKHPIPALVLAIVLTLAGALTAMRLPIAEYPDIAPPTVFVDASYIGADASVVNNTVAQIIEDTVNTAGDIEFMSSSIDTAGNYGLQIVFKLGIDTDTAVNKSTPESVMLVNLTSPNSSHDGLFMRNYATVYFMDKIKRVDGVGSAVFFGGEYAMRIWLNLDKLADLGLTVADVESAIKEQNVQAAVGSFVRLKNFTRVEIGSRDTSTVAFCDGQPAASFMLTLTNEANTLETLAAVKEILAEAGKTSRPT